MGWKLVEISAKDAVDGESYITKMKHGFIEGYWNKEEGTCHGYYWSDIEWFPYALYKMIEED